MSHLVDVRSEAEFSKGHIPGAHHIPLLHDSEHQEVGTLYKTNGFDTAFSKALEFVGPKMSSFVSQLTAITDKFQHVTLYCARGGMRSQSLLWLYEQAGFQVEVMPGGYKKYRDQVLHSFKKPLNLKIICGLTGTGKTDYLQQLDEQGKQVLNLEGLAKHRGSVFGPHSKPQPTSQQFENELFEHLQLMDPFRTIWVEDESRMIGSCPIPKDLYEQMKLAPSVLLDIPIEVRIQNILKEYAPQNKSEVHQRIEQILLISKRLGLERTKCAIAAVQNGQFELAVSLILPYYDKTYRHSFARRQAQGSP